MLVISSRGLILEPGSRLLPDLNESTFALRNLGCVAICRGKPMKRLFLIFLGGVAGFIAGYFAGVVVACDWLIPTSNLCGIYGVFLTGPIGFVIGIGCGWLASRRAKT